MCVIFETALLNSIHPKMADHLTLEYLDRIVPLLRFPFDLIAAIRNKLFSISSSAGQIEFISVSEQESFSTIKKLLDNESEKRGLINRYRHTKM